MAYRETHRVRERKAAQRDALLHAAEQLVREGGFVALTIQTLAARAGVGVGTVYRYFDAKSALATEVFSRATEREVAAVSAAITGNDAPEQRLSRAVDTFARRALRAPRLAWSLIAEPVDPAVDAARLHYRAAYTDLFETLIAEGVASGRFPAQPTRLSAAALVGAMAEALIGPLVTQPVTDAVIDPVRLFCLRAVGALESSS